MSPRRPSLAFALCSSLALLAGLAACGADPPGLALVNDPDPSDPGYGGEAGSSGQAGQAGSSGNQAGGSGGQAGGSGGSSGGSSGGTSQGGSSGNQSGGSSGSAGGSACDGSNAEGVTVAPLDLYRYPSYAVDGCSLLYLSPVGDGAELRLRDLATGSEEVLAPSTETPRRPSIAGGVAAWEAISSSTSVVRVRVAGKPPVTIEGSFARATEPSAAPDAVAFTAWHDTTPGADTDVLLYLVETGELKTVAASAGQQRFADASLGRVAYTDFSEDPDGVFNDGGNDLADVAVFDRASGETTVHKKAGKQAFPLVGSEGHVVFLEWPGEHPEPKLQAYGVRSWAVGQAVDDRVLGDVDQSTGGDIPRPTTRGGLVEWVMYPVSGTVLYRASLSSDAPAAVVAGAFEGKQLFAPASAGPFSVIATRPVSNPSVGPSLTVLPH